MDASHVLLVCLLGSLPGPWGVYWEDSYFQLFPIDKTKCPTIDPRRDIFYELYTSENPLQADMINVNDDEALARSHFDFYKPTVLFFHAFFESSSSDSANTIKTAYLQRKDYNVILLQAQRMEAGPWYLTASRNTRVVGEYTATFVDYLVSRGMDLNSLHLIGLSLGAQMAGICGQNVKSGRIQRITGLDPAGPLFTKWPRNLKLDSGDAEFVDVIHTDAGIFGYPRPVGHVDFWPNKGQSPQPGCRLEEVKQRSPDAFLIEPLFCSHWRSYQFYAESVINPNSFLAVSCKSWSQFVKGACDDNAKVNMGINVSPEARGNFYLTTRDVSPFSLQSQVPQRQLQVITTTDAPQIEYSPPQHTQQHEENFLSALAETETPPKTVLVEDYRFPEPQPPSNYIQTQNLNQQFENVYAAPAQEQFIQSAPELIQSTPEHFQSAQEAFPSSPPLELVYHHQRNTRRQRNYAGI